MHSAPVDAYTARRSSAAASRSCGCASGSTAITVDSQATATPAPTTPIHLSASKTLEQRSKWYAATPAWNPIYCKTTLEVKFSATSPLCRYPMPAKTLQGHPLRLQQLAALLVVTAQRPLSSRRELATASKSHNVAIRLTWCSDDNMGICRYYTRIPSKINRIIANPAEHGIIIQNYTEFPI